MICSAPEILASRQAQKAAGQPIETSPEFRQRVEALTDDGLSRLCRKHGIGIVEPFVREVVIEDVLARGVGDAADFAGIIS